MGAYAAARKESGFAWEKAREGFYREAGAATFKVVVAGGVTITGIVFFVVNYADARLPIVSKRSFIVSNVI